MYFKKKTKGILILEATITVPFFLIIFVCIFLNLRLYTVQGFIHTVLTEATQKVNQGMQIINVLKLENPNGGIPSKTSIQDLENNLCSYYTGGTYSSASKNMYENLGMMSMEGVEETLCCVYEKEIHRFLDDYLKKTLPSFVMKADDIEVTKFTITDTSIGKKLDCEIAYVIHYPFELIEDIEKTMRISTYLE